MKIIYIQSKSHNSNRSSNNQQKHQLKPQHFDVLSNDTGSFISLIFASLFAD